MLNKRALKLKEKLRNGELSPGLWVATPSPTVCEIIADAGLDWILVDAEHSPFNPETLLHMLMAFKGSETVPLIRVPWNDPVFIKQMLDMGWEGVVIPQVNTPEDAQKAVSACRYPPAGTRGFGPRRAENYGRDREEFLNIANASVLCVIQIEDVKAAGTIEDIVAQPGIDWIIVGRWDMSGSLNQLGQIDSPLIWDAVKKIFDAAQKRGIPTGNAIAGVENLDEAVKLGCQLIGFGEDTNYLVKGIDSDLKKFKEYTGISLGKGRLG